MALIFMDGFDHYTTTAAMAYKWNAVDASVAPNKAGRRSGSLAVSNNNASSGYFRRSFSAAISTVTVGFAINIESLGGSDKRYFVLTDQEGGAQITVCALNTGEFIIRLGGVFGSIIATASVAMTTGVWNYFELKVYVANSSGTVELRLNGATVASYTGDTQATGYANIMGIDFGGVSSYSPIFTVDDLYVCDASGSVNNTFLGDVRVDTIFPTGAGNSTQFTPSTGANWENVDDASPDGDSTYNSGDTAGYKDTFVFGDLSIASATIHGIQTNICARKDDAGTRTMTDVVRTASTDYTGGTTHSLADGYLNYRTIRETNPNTSAAWAVSEVNGAEFGYAVTA